VSTRTTRSPEETEALGAEVAAGLDPGAVVVISGELGAGKTTFVRGACRALGVAGAVTSPTFTIGRRYRGDRVAVAHLDLYRLAGIDDEEPALLDDYLDAETITFVEWPAGAADRLAAPTLEVRMSHAGADARVIDLESASQGA